MVRPEDLVLLDETCSHLGYTSAYTWALRRPLAYAVAPMNRGENKNAIATVTLDRGLAVLQFDDGMTSDRFVG